jgi:Ca-activated chloride channel family protein
MMTFANPEILWGLLLVPLALLFLAWAERSRKAAVAQLGEAPLMQRLSRSVNWNGRKWRSRFWLLALALAIIALARPQWGSTVQVVEQEGVQVMVLLDVSKSMLAQDIKPDRLTRAKLEISDLMDQLNGDEIGLVLFSGASFIQFPLTSDYDTARSFLDSARPESISRPGTEIGDAIRTAMNGFDEKRESQKVMVIVTDGENHQPEAIAEAKKAADEGVMIYTIGFGSPQGEPIPELAPDGSVDGYLSDQNGEVVLSRLDEATLSEIARVGRGQYYRASADGSELAALTAELDRLQAAQLDSRFETTKIERFQIFLLGAVLALMAAELIPGRVREKTARAWVLKVRGLAGRKA